MVKVSSLVPIKIMSIPSAKLTTESSLYSMVLLANGEQCLELDDPVWHLLQPLWIHLHQPQVETGTPEPNLYIDVQSSGGESTMG